MYLNGSPALFGIIVPVWKPKRIRSPILNSAFSLATEPIETTTPVVGNSFAERGIQTLPPTPLHSGQISSLATLSGSPPHSGQTIETRAFATESPRSLRISSICSSVYLLPALPQVTHSH